VNQLRSFARFWRDLVVGDDWLVAVGVVLALVLTVLLAQTDVAAWWVMPLAAAFLLAASLRRATNRRG
jgi:hypothetical protein